MIHLRNNIYYFLKPFLPRKLQIFFRRKYIRYQMEKYKDIWPIDHQAGAKPKGWRGWPEGKKFALVLTHDVDTAQGQNKCLDLMKLEKELGFHSSFNFVPLGYDVSPDLRKTLCEHGFEVGVHGLYHNDGDFSLQKIFCERATRINQYIKEWNAVGYRAPCMYHKLPWFHELEIEYDASTFDTDPFEPHPQGAGTIFPFMVIDESSQREYVELPYTLPQDFTLFVLMQEKNIEVWNSKLDWIARKGGMVLMNTHPDYMSFGTGKLGNEEYPSRYYAELLKHIQENYAGQYWHALPRDVARFWKSIYSMDWLQWKTNVLYSYYYPDIIQTTRNRNPEIFVNKGKTVR